MYINDLPIPVQIILIIYSSILSVSALVIVVLVSLNRKWNRQSIVSFILMLCTFALLILQEYCYKLEMNQIREEWNLRLPVWLVIALLFFMSIFFVWSIILDIRSKKKSFSNSTVREAINNLPTGLCFSDTGGKVFLCNQSANEYAKKITGHIIYNTNDFWHEICHKKNDDGENTNATIITIADNQVLQFNSKLIGNGRDAFIQITIGEITAQYKLYLQLEENNRELIKQHQRARELTDTLIKNNHADEVLQQKIRIHNEFGQMILATRRTLKEGGEIDLYKQTAREWSDLATRMKHISKSKNQESSRLLDEILTISRQIGCEVTFENNIPKEIADIPLIRQALREAVINAVRHGGANRLRVSFKDNVLTIKNNGVVPPEKIIPKGGLKNLSEGIFALGGSLSFTIEKEFGIVIALPK